LHDALIINCIPTPLSNDISPYENLHGTCYDVSIPRVFGCLCNANTITVNRKKLDRRANPRILIGFKPNTKRYMFLNLKTHNTGVSRHEIFHENLFRYHTV